MKRYKAAIRICSYLLVAVMAAVPLSARALDAPQPGISVSPAQLEFNLSPSKLTQVQTIELTNTYDVNQSLSAEFQAIDETGARLVPKGSLDSTFAKALKVSATDILIPAKGSYKLQVAVDSTGLSGGGHYASLVLTQQSKSVIPQGYRSAVAVNLFVIKDENIRTNLKLVGSSVGGILFSMPSTGTLTFKNLGNTHVVPRASISLYDKDTLVSKAVINQTSLPLFPNQQASYTGSFDSYKTILFPKKLRSIVSYRIDGSDIQLTKESTFWYIPLKPIAFALTACVILFVWRRQLWRGVKKIVHRVRAVFVHTKPKAASVAVAQNTAQAEQTNVQVAPIARYTTDSELERKVAKMMEEDPQVEPELEPEQNLEQPLAPTPILTPTARPISITFAEETEATLEKQDESISTPKASGKKAKKTAAKTKNKPAKNSKKTTKNTKITITK